MSNDPADAQRRSVLQITAGLAAASTAVFGNASAAASPPKPTGQPGDFAFLTGEWRIKNRQFKNGAWEAFDGEATVYGILAGVGSVEELRIPSRNFSGMGLRLLDVERKLWADHWVNAKSGVLTPPPSWGSFVDGVGIWDADDQEGDTPVIYRGVWDQITASSCRWYQASSRDGGASWQESWVMHWTRR
ncbi:MAG: hypothetical protein KAZ63_00050 [Vitreoscilla sp.]|nr:hypothetical protein [Vitreoscilla sp.]